MFHRAAASFIDQQTDNGDIRFRMNAANDDLMILDGSAMRVGIGTTSPANTLHVNSGGSNGVAKFESTDNMASIAIADNDTTIYVVSETNYGSFGGTNDLATTNLNIHKTTGYVGIGTTSPTDSLAVRGGIKIGEFNDTDGTGYAGTSPPSDHNTGTGAADPQIRVSGRSTGNPGIIQLAQFDANNFLGGTTQFELGRV